MAEHGQVRRRHPSSRLAIILRLIRLHTQRITALGTIQRPKIIHPNTGKPVYQVLYSAEK